MGQIKTWIPIVSIRYFRLGLSYNESYSLAATLSLKTNTAGVTLVSGERLKSFNNFTRSTRDQ